MKTKDVIRDLLPSEKSSFSWPAGEANGVSLALHIGTWLQRDDTRSEGGGVSLWSPLGTRTTHSTHPSNGWPSWWTRHNMLLDGWQWEASMGGQVWIPSPPFPNCATLSKLLNLFSSPTSLSESTHQFFAYFTVLLRELSKAVPKGFVVYKEENYTNSQAYCIVLSSPALTILNQFSRSWTIHEYKVKSKR